ncbi:hypothetical protein [Candidatus Palauibacter sp.]|uniref:hypothetical protein n=1 Tax=Candidatus Palauibacter sp. TaxID=3101350 RepID=UPI003B5AB9A3
MRLREGGREAEIVIGPVALPAAGPHLRPQVQLAELPLAGWLHGFSWDMRDRNGNPLPDRLLHHVNVIDPDNRELFSSVPRRVLAAGRETKSVRLPSVLGIPVASGARVLVSAMSPRCRTGRSRKRTCTSCSAIDRPMNPACSVPGRCTRSTST